MDFIALLQLPMYTKTLVLREVGMRADLVVLICVTVLACVALISLPLWFLVASFDGLLDRLDKAGVTKDSTLNAVPLAVYNGEELNVNVRF